MDTAPSDRSEAVFRLLYRSHDLIPAERRKVELGELFSIARSQNKQKGVTGALMVSDGHFVQVLEGDETVVRELYDHIAADPRHDQVELVDTADGVPRVFARWAMAEVGEDGSADVPLIAHRDGISAAAGHKTTPAQDAVLDVMRSTATGARSGT